MIALFKILSAAGLAAGIGAADLDTNQPPGGGDRKGGPPAADRRGGPDRPQGEPRGGPDRGNRAENRGPQDRPGEHRADPGVQAWVNSLVEKMTDPHDTIRDSARAGLVAVGHAAVPTLKKLADDGEGAKAVAARKVLEAIARHHQGPTPPGMPGRGGPGPMGFGTAGGGFGMLSQFLGGGGAPQPGGGPRPEAAPQGGGPRGGMNPGGLGGGARPEGGPMGGGRRPEVGPPNGPDTARPGPGGLPGRGGPGGEGGRPGTPPRPPVPDDENR